MPTSDYHARHQAKRNAHALAWARANRARKSALAKINRHVQEGKIARPAACAACGAMPPHGTVPEIDAATLELTRWICRACYFRPIRG